MKRTPVAIVTSLVGAAAIVVAVQFGWLTDPTTAGGPATLSPSVSSSSSGSLEAAGFAVVDDAGQAAIVPSRVEEALAQLTSASVEATGYERDLFGQRWADVDRNGCDTRNDILARDLTDVTFKAGTRDCVVLTGTLHDTYTGTTITFERGDKTSQLVQIDHVVPLSWAWRYGAGTWTPQQREQFANDPINLQAVDGSANASKSDSGPAGWLPPAEGYRCEYVARYVLVLTAYSLPVDDLDRRAISDTLNGCTG